MDGIDIIGTGIDAGCSASIGVLGGDTTGVDAVAADTSVEGLGETSSTVSSVALVLSSLAARVSSALGSEVFESMLDRPVSATAAMAGLRNTGLSGRDPRSDEGLDSALSVPLFTALARRSCSREFGLLREEFRDAPVLLASPRPVFPRCSQTTHLAQLQASCPLPSQKAPALLRGRPPAPLQLPGHLQPRLCRAATPGLIWRCSTSLSHSSWAFNFLALLLIVLSSYESSLLVTGFSACVCSWLRYAKGQVGVLQVVRRASEPLRQVAA